MAELSFHRQNIDAIDDEILRLLNERAKHVMAVGEIKKKEGSPVWVPSREEAIYERLTNNNEGGLFPTSSIRPVFREIISASLSLEEVLRVGYFGIEGSFSNLAGIKHFGLSAQLIPAGTLPDVFEGVEKGRLKYGIIPIENSIEGVVNHTLDMLMESNVVIMGEIYVDISQNLLSRSGELSEIKGVYSHPHALAQCRSWLSKHLPNVHVYETESTSNAAERAKNDETIAAIGSELSEVVYNLKIVERNIEDNPNNHTRFLIIGKQPREVTGNDKTSVMFGVKHEPGSLCRVLEIFDRRGVNLTKLESRPSKRIAWEYLFYTDLDGHKDENPLKDAIEEVKKHVSIIKVLGSYPRNQQ